MREVRCIVWWIALLVAVSMAECAEAQIRIIPQTKIDSIKQPATLDTRAMEFRGGNNLSFGTINEADGVWEGVIEWQNVGERQLVITRTSSSCSCLRAEVDRTPVKAGEKSSITLQYDPRNRSGRVSQRVMIYTNLSEKLPTAVLTLEGEVRPLADRRGDYPYLRGELALRRDTIMAKKGEEIRVACMNVGTKPLRIVADSLLSGRNVVAYTEPRVLQAGEEGDLVIRYKIDDRDSRPMPHLYLTGLNLPPRQRCLVVKFED